MTPKQKATRDVFGVIAVFSLIIAGFIYYPVKMLIGIIGLGLLVIVYVIYHTRVIHYDLEEYNKNKPIHHNNRVFKLRK